MENESKVGNNTFLWKHKYRYVDRDKLLKLFFYPHLMSMEHPFFTWWYFVSLIVLGLTLIIFEILPVLYYYLHFLNLQAFLLWIFNNFIYQQRRLKDYPIPKSKPSSRSVIAFQIFFVLLFFQELLSVLFYILLWW